MQLVCNQLLQQHAPQAIAHPISHVQKVYVLPRMPSHPGHPRSRLLPPPPSTLLLLPNNTRLKKWQLQSMAAYRI